MLKSQIERSRKASARDQAKHRPRAQRQGHSKFPLKRRPLRERSGVEILQPVVLTGLCGKACAKEAFLLQAFLVPFVATKDTALPAANERVDVFS